MYKGITTILGFCFLLPFSVSAQVLTEDVCCITATVSQDAVSTTANVRSGADCKAGQKSESETICRAVPDPDNTCSLREEKERCESCGFHWSGRTCLTENPVEKAKTQLEEERKKAEEEKKQEAAKKAGRTGQKM